ncbi:sensor histidine kinase [Tenacibaculum sp. MAR_2009_124]|uniref:sensor histidine kinase n=1 Tax=Tenacibaculum sp. MAR_2009_124 TaxID=1250059 RepID=UPI002100A891|nr:histidine kinase [Tenacibaculum sp. MAR_2009_124]
MTKKRRKKIGIKISISIILLFITLFIDRWINIPDNPVTITLMLVFWFVIFNLFAPKFIQKYKKILIVFYSGVLVAFYYYRFQADQYEHYLAVKNEWILPILIGSLPLLVLLWGYEQWKLIDTLKQEKTQAEMSLLKSQINPHFFFNTLNNLYALTIKNSDRAPEVILKLSDMMRYTIYEGEKERVPIEREINYLKNYIELHKIRYRNNNDIQFNIDNTENNEIAPLLFIILVENAFKHGIERLTTNPFIRIQLVSNSKGIFFSIKNNFEEENDAIGGIGLKNLERRLALTYPDKYDLSIKKLEKEFEVQLNIYMHD